MSDKGIDIIDETRQWLVFSALCFWEIFLQPYLLLIFPDNIKQNIKQK